MVTFEPLAVDERAKLTRLLRENVKGRPIRMMPDTSFTEEEAADEKRVIDAIFSVPCHY